MAFKTGGKVIMQEESTFVVVGPTKCLVCGGRMDARDMEQERALMLTGDKANYLAHTDHFIVNGEKTESYRRNLERMAEAYIKLEGRAPQFEGIQYSGGDILPVRGEG